VIIMTLLTAMQRFSTIATLRSKLLCMYHAKDYFCVELLGSGQFSDVYKGFHKLNGRPAAVKKMKYLTASEAVQRALTREVQVMRNMNHDRIIKLLDSFQIDTYLYIVMEYSPMGDLENYIKRHNGAFDPAEVSHLMTELALGLRFLRSKSIVHRDMKPANILLFPNQSASKLVLKLCDFTMARELVSGDMAKTLCGSPLYMAPEVLNRQRYTDKADLWSVGVIMYRLLFNRLPFTGVNEWDLRENLNKSEVYLPPEHPISDSTRDLLFGLLQKDPLLRISWDEFFAHDFLEREALSLNGPLSPRQSDADPSALIAELQLRLREYADRMGKASVTIQRLEKEVSESSQREAMIQQQAQADKQTLEKRLSEAEAVIEVLRREQSYLQQELQKQVRQQAVYLSRSGGRSMDPDRMDYSNPGSAISTSVAGSGMGSAMATDDYTTDLLRDEINRIEEIRQRRNRSLSSSSLSGGPSGSSDDNDRMMEDIICDLMSKTKIYDEESKRFQIERFTLQTELTQYRNLFEAAAEESTKNQANYREAKAMENLLRDELREKEQMLREKALLEVQYQEQLQTLEMQLRNAKDEIASYEGLFKQLEQQRMMVAQAQAQAAQAQAMGQMPSHISGVGEYPPKSPQPQPNYAAQQANLRDSQPPRDQQRRGGGLSAFFGLGGGNNPAPASPAKK
jgi:serine/threonine protein kinase